MSSNEDKASFHPGAAGARIFGHLVGVAIIALLVALPYRAGADALVAVVQDAQLAGGVLARGGLHLVLSATIWGIVVLTFSAARERLDTTRRVKIPAGTAMLETLIVLPVFLLLVFGLGQLLVNNITAIFVNLATFQAARTAWLWEGEPCGTDPSCDQETRAAEMAKVQAAATLTPVAPGDFEIEEPSDASSEFYQLRGLLVGTQLPDASPNSGNAGLVLAGQMVDSAEWTLNDSTFAIALGVSPFAVRTARQMTSAYAGTTVDVTRDGDMLTVELRYEHLCAFPLVGAVFGRPAIISGRPGYYALYERSYEQRRLPEARREAIISDDIGPLLL